MSEVLLAGAGAAERLMARLIDAGLQPRLFAGIVPYPTTVSLGAGLAVYGSAGADPVLGGSRPVGTVKDLGLLVAAAVDFERPLSMPSQWPLTLAWTGSLLPSKRP